MLDAATTLFLEGGYDAITANLVSQQSGVAVGTLYGRFGNKDGLVRAVQVHLLAQFETSVSALERSPALRDTRVEDLVPVLITSLLSLLAEHASMLQPIMRRAADDPETAERGRASHERLRSAFLHAAAPVLPAIRCHDDPADAMNSCFTIAYAAFARALGLGSGPDTTDISGLPKLARDLGAMCQAFLFRN